ncbi:Imm64 family immunity protein [Exiguobacterium sp. s28]|uniref:Imm64 family immunity protein n=1 Tax=Exiguobacterium sp. s28 TaxID=2751238 RepID=UPI001BEA99BA|nr:Imm64 family immunity protein [Exiguobacterium sp. s28]
MRKSGGFVSIGIAFTIGSGLVRNLQIVCDALMQDGGEVDHISYSQDEDGTEWVTIEPTGSDLDLSQIQYYGSVTLSTARFGRRYQIVTVSVRDEIGFEGLLIDLDWEDLFVDTNMTESFVRATASVERLLIDVYRSASFAYAVAGHEIELDWAPKTFLQERNLIESLSLSVIPIKDGLKLVHGSIALDGMTSQLSRTYLISV